MTLKDILSPEELQALLTSDDNSDAGDSESTEALLRLEVSALRRQTARLENSVQVLTDRLEQLESRLSPEALPNRSPAEEQSAPTKEPEIPEDRIASSRLEKHGRKKKNRWLPQGR